MKYTTSAVDSSTRIIFIVNLDRSALFCSLLGLTMVGGFFVGVFISSIASIAKHRRGMWESFPVLACYLESRYCLNSANCLVSVMLCFVPFMKA